MARSPARTSAAATQSAAMMRLQRESMLSHGLDTASGVAKGTPATTEAEMFGMSEKRGRLARVMKAAAQAAKRFAAEVRGARRRKIARPHATKAPCQIAATATAAACCEETRKAAESESTAAGIAPRSEEHTSELQSPCNL